jgi:hypothetical protein
MVFGARGAPSYFSLTSDIRANVATSYNLHSYGPLATLAAAANVEPLPKDWSASRSLAPAIQDACHSPLNLLEQSTDGHSTFVDENGVAAYLADIWRALHQSIESAYMIYGYPGDDCRDSCISDGKWEAHVNHIMEYLGFIINSHDLTVTWPLFKALRSEIMIILSRERGAATPKEFASVLGKLRYTPLLALPRGAITLHGHSNLP